MASDVRCSEHQSPKVKAKVLTLKVEAWTFEAKALKHKAYSQSRN